MLVDIQTVSIVIAASGVFIAAVNQILSRRRTEKTEQLSLETRQAQLFMQVYNRWSSRDFVKAYGLIRYKYRWKDVEDAWNQFSPEVNPEGYTDYQTHAIFFEGLGMLVREKLIDIRMVEDLFSQRIIWFWENAEPIYRWARELTQDPTMYDSFEYLYNVMKKRQQQTTTSN